MKGHNAALQGFTRPGTKRDENFGMSCAPGAGQITQPVDLQSSVLRLPISIKNALVALLSGSNP